jgi:hypothetical protein
MTLYVAAKYLHIVGTLSLFVALGFEWAMLVQLRRAQASGQIREWVRVSGWLHWLGAVSLGAILVPGFYMTATVWRGEQPWIGLSFAVLVIVAILGAVGARRRSGIIRDALVEEGPLPAAIKGRLRDSFSWISMQTRTALLLAIVFLMTAKPDFIAAIWTIAAALLASSVASAAVGLAAPSQRGARQA